MKTILGNYQGVLLLVNLSMWFPSYIVVKLLNIFNVYLGIFIPEGHRAVGNFLLDINMSMKNYEVHFAHKKLLKIGQSAISFEWRWVIFVPLMNNSSLLQDPIPS